MNYKILKEEQMEKIKHINENSISLFDDYYNIAYCIEVLNGLNNKYIKIYKNDDGIEPIISYTENFIYVGYGHHVSIVDIKDFSIYKNYEFGSIVYEITTLSDGIFIILELDVVKLDFENRVIWENNFSGIITNYKFNDNYLKITIDEVEKYSIDILTGNIQ